MSLARFPCRILLIVTITLPSLCYGQRVSNLLSPTYLRFYQQPTTGGPYQSIYTAYQAERPLPDQSNVDKLLALSAPQTSLAKTITPPIINPREKLLREAPMHTERAWLYSAIIPGLGQLYNQNYWRLPLIYGILAGLVWGATYNHDEYMTAKREFIAKNKKLKKTDEDISSSPLGQFMSGRKRDRTIFIVAIGVWHVINIFDAYVGGTLKTFDVSDDLSVVIKPSEGDPKSPGIGFGLGLQPRYTDK